MLKRKRILSLATAIILSIGIPLVFYQEYFKYNAYLLPIVGLIAVLLYIGFFLTRSAFIEWLRVYYKKRPKLSMVLFIGAVPCLVIIIVYAEWFAIVKSKEHVDNLKTRDNYNKQENRDTSTLGKSAQSTPEEIARAVKKAISPQIKTSETTKYPPDITKAKQTLINSINQFNPNQKLKDVSTIVPGYFKLSADPSPNSHYSSCAVETKNIFSTNFYASIRLQAVENVQTMDFMGRDIWVCINPSWDSFLIWESEQSQTVWKPIRVKRNPVFNTLAHCCPVNFGAISTGYLITCHPTCNFA